MATVIDLATTRWTEQAVRPIVYTRANWADAWTEQPHLHCSVLRTGVGGQIDQASFQFEYGQMHYSGEADPETVDCINLDRHFVKIRIELPNSLPAGDLVGLAWYGVIVHTVDRPLGVGNIEVLETEAGAPLEAEDDEDLEISSTKAGDQTFTAYGLEWLLTRVFIDKSVYESSGGSDVTIKTVLAFNSGTKRELDAHDVQILGNKSPTQNRFVAPDEVASAEVWTAADIIDYLFDVFTPTTAPPWELDASVADACAWYEINNLVVGPTLYDALNTLINHKRGLTWSVVVAGVDAIETATIKVHSFAAAAVALTGGATLPANAAQVTLDAQVMRQVSPVTVKDTSPRFEQVKVRGARRGSCFTLSYQDDTIEAGWSSFQLEQYAKAAEGTTPVAELKRQADAFRASDNIGNVLTRFVVPIDWDGTVGNGKGTALTKKPACPAIESGGALSTTVSSGYWMPGLRIASWIPLRENVDYQYDAANPVDFNEPGQLPPYRKPFALYETNDGKYVRADRANVLVHNEAVTASKTGFKFSSDVTPLSDQMGIFLRPSTLPHAHSDNTDLTTVLSTFQDTSDIRPQTNWKKAIVTAFAEFDEHAEAVWPSTIAAAVNGQQSVLVINVGNSCRLDYLAPNTVLDVTQSGDVLANSSGGILRDDRPKLERIARVAWEWYSSPRSALTLEVNHITTEFVVGQLLVELSGDPVNSLVTYMVYDFDNSTTSVSTSFAEIDPVGLFI